MVCTVYFILSCLPEYVENRIAFFMVPSKIYWKLDIVIYGVFKTSNKSAYVLLLYCIVYIYVSLTKLAPENY